MIVSANIEAQSPEFERLLENSVSLLESDAKDRPKYYLSRSGDLLEKDVYEAMCDKAKGSVFDNTIELVSGQRFPDIVAKKYWGVEVKSTKQNHWTNTGNSVLETTRVDTVQRIYMFFGKLFNPIGFRYRRYEECLCEVTVTHSPRYLINMDTPSGESIFDRMGISYEDLRENGKPIQQIIRYYRSILKPGEDLWWLDKGETNLSGQPMTVRLWGNLPSDVRDRLQNEAMALFPEIFGNGNKKYARVATWLVGTHGIVSPSCRDTFTAGGKVEIRVKEKVYKGIPKIFQHLQNKTKSVAECIETLPDSSIEDYWGEKVPKKKRVKKWIELVKANSQVSLKGTNLSVEDMINDRLNTG